MRRVLVLAASAALGLTMLAAPPARAEADTVHVTFSTDFGYNGFLGSSSCLTTVTGAEATLTTSETWFDVPPGTYQVARICDGLTWASRSVTAQTDMDLGELAPMPVGSVHLVAP